MSNSTNFDLIVAHRYFAVECFNRAWDLIDKDGRTPEEDEQMLQMSLASTWHWSQRPDCTATNLSIGYWQTSRIYALLGQADNARRYGLMCLHASQKEGVLPFYFGYALEALARSEAVGGDKIKMEAYLHRAHQIAENLYDIEEKQQLLNDLDTVRVKESRPK